MTPTAVRAVQAMVAPVVLVTTAAIFSGALLTLYSSIDARMRAMTNERREILTDRTGALLSTVDVPPTGRERLGQIDHELPLLLRRHRLLHNAVLLIFAGVSVLVLSVIAIGVAVTTASDGVGTAGLALVLRGTVTLLAGLVLAARSIMISQDAIDYEVARALSLGS
jgi:Protein of unknown function (DUF2721)